MQPEPCGRCGTPLDRGAIGCPQCGVEDETVGLSQLPTVRGPEPAPSDAGEPLPRPFGRFTLLRRVGRGGMGTVYEAEDHRLGRRVALKTLISTERHGAARERFLREARIAANLDHPNVVAVYDSGDLDGTLYYTMPLVRGLSFEAVIHYLHGKGGRAAPPWLPVPHDRAERIGCILQWFEGALAGLQHAHDRGIVHRDLKPSNLLLDAETQLLRIADFGLARAGHLSGVTRAGSMLGTVAYMSPEQVRGDMEQIDRRSDVYSMGVTLFRALLDRLPYDADTTADYLNKILTTAPQLAGRSSEIPSDLATILFKALEKARGDRYADADSFREDIARFRRYEPIRASPPGLAGRLLRWAKRKPAAATLCAFLVVGGGVTSVLLSQVVRSSRILRGQEIARLFDDANYALSTGEFEMALAGFDRVIGLDPGHLLARIERAMTLYESGPDAEQARRALADLDVVERLQPGLVSSRELRRMLQTPAGREVTKREAESPDTSSPTVALDRFLLGDLARMDGDCSRAVVLYNAALRADPRQPLALLNRGLCYRELKEHERAVRDAEVLSRVWPEHWMAHNNLGIALTDTREFEDAFAAFERARALDPGSAVIEFNYGVALDRAGRHEEAQEHLRASIDMRPDFSDARNQLGRLLLRTGRLDEAVAEFEEIILIESAKPGDPGALNLGRAWTNLCDAHLIRRDLVQAERACRKCLGLFPGQPNSHYNMAMLHMLRGDRDAALAALDRNVELGDRESSYLEQDVVFLPLHGDARFQTLLARMRGLPE